MRTRIGILRHPRLVAAVTAVVVAAGLGAATGTTTATAASVAFTSTSVNQGSGLCMDDPNSSTSAGTQLIQWSCNTGNNQNWSFTPVSGTTASYTITSVANLCVDVSGRSTADNAQVIQYTCNGQTNQEFTLQPVSVSGVTNTFNLVAVHSGKCIVPTGDSTANDTLLVQLPCSGATTRVWRLPAYTSGGSGGNTVSVTNPGTQTTTVGAAVSLQMTASDSASGQTFAYSASGLPAGLSISSSGLISGSPTTAGTSGVVVTAKDGTGASGTADRKSVV